MWAFDSIVANPPLPLGEAARSAGVPRGAKRNVGEGGLLAETLSFVRHPHPSPLPEGEVEILLRSLIHLLDDGCFLRRRDGQPLEGEAIVEDVDFDDVAR